MANQCPKCQTGNPEDSKFCKECATPLPGIQDVIHTQTLETPTEKLTRGSVFAGRYEIIEELGKGGMGRVYRVEDKKIKREIALKLIKPEIASDKKTIERFKNELTTARDIRHKNVCGMFDLGEEKGQHFITMEYVSGGDLKRLIRRTKRLDTGTAISISKQICEGLAEAHSLGFVHRDLKPNNIMIDDNGNARIMDFGIARTVKGKGITGSGIMIGTPEYMSPEQVEAKDIDQRSDIYSLGIIMYETLTGRLPFEADTPFAIGVKHKSEIPKDPTEFNPQIPDDLAGIILKCLEKSKENRYQSVDEVRSELEKLEKGLPTTDRVIPKKKTLTSKEFTVTFGVKKVLFPIVAVISVIILALFILKPWSKKEEIQVLGNKPSLAVMYFENITGDNNYDSWEFTIPDSLITVLFQSNHIRVLSSDHILSILRKLDLTDARNYDHEDLIAVAAAGGVSHILKGTLSKSGEIFRINYQLQDMIKEEMVASDQVEGEGDKPLFTMTDALTIKIKEAFNLTQAQMAIDEDRGLFAMTTSSYEAYTNYMEGRRHSSRMNPIEAIPFYKKAVKIDPDFALAYRFLGTSLGQIGYSEEAQKNLQKAFDLSNRLPERERLHIQARYYMYSDRKTALELYNRILEIHPYDFIANNNLGYIYIDLGELENGINRLQTAIQYKTHIYDTYHALTFVFLSRGQPEKAKNVVQIYVDSFGNQPFTYQDFALILMREGKYDLALLKIEKALTLSPSDIFSQLLKGDIYLYKDDLIKAEEEFQKLAKMENSTAQVLCYLRLIDLDGLHGKFKTKNEKMNEFLDWSKEFGDRSWEMSARRVMAYNELISGNPTKALEELNLAWDIAVDLDDLGKKIRILFQKGLLYLSSRSLEEAKLTAEELKGLVEQSELASEQRFYNHLKGTIELGKKNYSLAIDYLNKALGQRPVEYTYYKAEICVDMIYSLATAYYQSGDLGKAIIEYEKISSPNTLRFGLGLSYEDLYARSFYMLGKIYEQQGNKSKAIEHYEKFLDLWKDADPGHPEVEDAKERLARLIVK